MNLFNTLTDGFRSIYQIGETASFAQDTYDQVHTESKEILFYKIAITATDILSTYFVNSKANPLLWQTLRIAEAGARCCAIVQGCWFLITDPPHDQGLILQDIFLNLLNIARLSISILNPSLGKPFEIASHLATVC